MQRRQSPTPAFVAAPLGARQFPSNVPAGGPNAALQMALRMLSPYQVDPTKLYDPANDVTQMQAAQADLQRRTTGLQVQDAQDEAGGANAGLQAWANGVSQLPTPVRQFSPFTPTDLPNREVVPMPERPAAQVDPRAMLASGLMGLIAPRGAPKFIEAALRGAADQANTEYGDRMARFRVASEDANRRYSDSVAGIERRDAADLSNIRGRESADYQNSVMARENALQALPVKREQASLLYKLGTPESPGALSRRRDALTGMDAATSALNTIGERVSSGMAKNADYRQTVKDANERNVDIVKSLNPMITTAIRSKQEADQFAKQLDLNDRKFKADNANDKARIGIEQGRLGVERQKAQISAADSGYTIGPDGKLVADPSLSDPDMRSFLEEQKQAGQALKSLQGGSLRVMARLSAQYRLTHPTASHAEVWKFAQSSPEYQFARKMEEDAAKRLQGSRLPGDLAGILVRSAASKAPPNSFTTKSGNQFKRVGK